MENTAKETAAEIPAANALRPALLDAAGLFTVYDGAKASQLPKGMKVPGFEPNGHPAVPARHDSYVFRRDVLRNVLAFLRRPHGDALFVTGPTGSGKTSAIAEVAARLNWPVQQVTCSGRMEFAALKGQFVLASANPGEVPSMQWRDGPLATAMKEGHILLLNEVDMCDPAELAGLNDVLEGRPLVLAENAGEIIRPHPMFRIVATANSCGTGDRTGLYEGVRTMNIASMDRYRVMEVGYIDRDCEVELLKKQLRYLPGEIIGAMADLASQIRELFVKDEISVPLSTRTLLRWAFLAEDFRGSNAALAIGLEEALLIRTNPEDRKVIENLVKTTFGDLWTKCGA